MRCTQIGMWIKVVGVGNKHRAADLPNLVSASGSAAHRDCGLRAHGLVHTEAADHVRDNEMNRDYWSRKP